jgi:periplasmic divalent cation tolerance protein
MSTADADAVHVVFCTCPNADVAESLAARLVEERLAACVNILPGVRSVYTWQGTVEQDEELLLMIKTTRARLDELVARVRALHPYDVPEVIGHPITAGHDAYLDWVRQCTTKQA